MSRKNKQLRARERDRQREKTAERIARADMPLIAQLLLIELDRGGGGG